MRLLLALLTLITILGCTTDPTTGKTVWDKAKTGRILEAAGKNVLTDTGKLAVGALEGAVMAAASGDRNTADLQQAAATGAWKSVGSIDVAADVGNIITAWNAGSAPAVAQAATNVYATINPQTPQQKKDAVNLIATTISTTAASPSTSSRSSTPSTGSGSSAPADGKAVKPLGKRSEVGGQRPALVLCGSGSQGVLWDEDGERAGARPSGRKRQDAASTMCARDDGRQDAGGWSPPGRPFGLPAAGDRAPLGSTAASRVTPRAWDEKRQDAASTFICEGR